MPRCVCALIKPGITIAPLASIVSDALLAIDVEEIARIEPSPPITKEPFSMTEADLSTVTICALTIAIRSCVLVDIAISFRFQDLFV